MQQHIYGDFPKRFPEKLNNPILIFKENKLNSSYYCTGTLSQYKRILIFLTLFFSALFYAQTEKNDALIADFTYLLKGKISKSKTDYVHEELFSLQVVKDRAFFISEKGIKFDSIFESEFQKAAINNPTNIDFRGKSFPRSVFPYTIIQSNQNVQYFENIGMTLLSYKEPTMNEWKLIDESETIKSFHCKKAEINYKGRNWVAWYSTDIPLSYGPYKFTGLPGLIIKISDLSGDYDFELVKSVSNDKLKDKVVSIKKSRYENAKETTPNELQKVKKNFTENLIGSLQSMQTSVAPEYRENLRNIQKRKQQNLIDENPIEFVNN